MNVEKLAEIVEEKRKALGMSMADVHKIAFPGTQSTAIQNLKRGTPPNLNTLSKLLEALGLEFYIGPPRTEPAPVTLLQDEPFDTVPRYDAASAAGNGVVNFDDPPIDYLAFSKTWLEQNGIHAGTCVLINVKGDSMEPSIYDGDLVMIDRRKKTIRTGRLYVFRDGDNGLRLKRLDIIPDTAIMLRSDNPKHPPEPRTGEAMNAISNGIVGEVIWSGHKWV